MFVETATTTNLFRLKSYSLAGGGVENKNIIKLYRLGKKLFHSPSNILSIAIYSGLDAGPGSFKYLKDNLYEIRCLTCNSSESVYTFKNHKGVYFESDAYCERCDNIGEVCDNIGEFKVFPRWRWIGGC